MPDIKLFTRYRAKWLMKKYTEKLGVKWPQPKTFAGMPVIPIEEGNRLVKQGIISGEPFAAARFGGTELRALWRSDDPFPLSARVKNDMISCICDLSGFFPAEDWAIEKFAEVMRSACGQIDVYGVWFNLMEDYAIEAYANNSMLTIPSALEPWFVEHPWSAALKGKRVLVIHPFKETILRQYEKREKLFDNPEILPEFASLRVVKAVQTIAGNSDERFRDWFEALDWMYAEAMKEDFDVAIIGCGAYGFPLAARIKEAGKQAIHMGGATQLLFGIKGNRWDQNFPKISGLYNDAWVRPAESERPKGAEMVEGACYW